MSEQLINVTEGPIHKQVIRLAWPAVSAMFLRTAWTIINAIWVGRLGASEMASVISSMFVIWMVFCVIDIIATGTVAVIARFYGAREIDKVSHTARQSIILTLTAAVSVSVVGFFTAPLAFKVMQVSPEVAKFGTGYLRIIFAFVWALVSVEVIASMFRASGDTKTPFIINMVGNGLNIILDPLLIFGIGPFPKMGVNGAAVGTVTTVVLGLILYLIMIKRGRLTFKFNWTKSVRPDYAMMKQIVKIGLPIATAGIVFSVVYLFMNRITASFGTDAVAALGIGNRCESLSYLGCTGFAFAVSTLVGQNLGAKHPDRAVKSVWWALGITCGITMLISTGFITLHKVIAAVFIDDPTVRTIAGDYLIILALSQSFMAIEIVLEGAFSGAGDTLPAMIVSIVGSFARVPLAQFFCYTLGAGVNGIWWSITLTTIVKGIILLYWFSRGKWKYKQVHG